ncbi:MAG: type II secretion system protein [Pedosphaera sp.]|nr:type II secretion system protein [Pedosphaera sp.]
MPKFNYRARNAEGKQFQGEIDLADRSAVIAQIDRWGLFPVAVESASPNGTRSAATQKAEGKLYKPSVSLLSRFRKPKSPKMEEIALFTNQLANLLKSGMQLVTALGSLSHVETKGLTSEISQRLQKDVKEGKSLSVAMSGQPHVFSDFYVNMVRAGEQSGALVDVLRRLSEHYERFAEMRHKVVSALIYPAFVIGVGFIIIIFFMTFMLPKFMKIFDGIKVPLPASTQILKQVSELSTNPWFLSITGILLFGLVYFFKRYLASKEGRKNWDAWLLRAPVISRITRPTLFGQFARALGTLLQNGVPVLTALKITEQVVPNAKIREAIVQTREGVTDGKSIAQPMARSKVFPDMMVHLIDIGEKTGDVPGTLNNLADAYDNELKVSLRVVTTLIEPVLIVIIASFVGFLLFGVLSAMFKITSSIGR